MKAAQRTEPQGQQSLLPNRQVMQVSQSEHMVREHSGLTKVPALEEAQHGEEEG